MTNPDIAEAGKNTQFKPGNTAHLNRSPGSNKPWSVKNAIRYIAALDVDEEFKPRTHAQKIALRQIELAEQGDTRAAEFVTERIDGKVANTNINADFERVQNMSDEELDAFIKEYTRKIEQAEAGINPQPEAE